jgi:hypothetical protein
MANDTRNSRRRPARFLGGDSFPFRFRDRDFAENAGAFFSFVHSFVVGLYPAVPCEYAPESESSLIFIWNRDEPRAPFLSNLHLCPRPFGFS